MSPWSPRSWRQKTAAQQAVYTSEGVLHRVLGKLSQLPPLVTSSEIESLKGQLAEASQGRRFLLQGGDCAESFAECTAEAITNKLKILLQMSLVLVHGSRKPVIRVGRFAGQYAKPRSDEFEIRDGVSLPSYRGDIVNRPGFSAMEREPDPELLLHAYERSALTLNFIRSMARGGFADLHHPENWDIGFAELSPFAEEYRSIVQRVEGSLQFMENTLGLRASELSWVDFFTSHEGLHLFYEEAQTRQASRDARWYNLSTHFPWLGVRTADPDGAHVEYLRGIANPIGIKVGPSSAPANVIRLLEILHPINEPGRVTLIHRFGNKRIADCLPPLIKAVESTGKLVLWSCDPMHGNMRTTGTGVKTRHFDDILGELEQAFTIHGKHGTYLGGVHIELTGDDVTECLGGARNLDDADLARDYRSPVDPRLNYEQALEMALLIARIMGRQRIDAMPTRGGTSG